MPVVAGYNYLKRRRLLGPGFAKAVGPRLGALGNGNTTVPVVYIDAVGAVSIESQRTRFQLGLLICQKRVGVSQTL